MTSEEKSACSLRQDAFAIWQAGVQAVDSARLVARQIAAWNGGLTICGQVWRAQPDSRICIVGAGKAGTGMVTGALQALGPVWRERVTGWVNVPADCVPAQSIPSNGAAAASSVVLHAARPAGVNEPTEAGVFGTRRILELVNSLRPQDLCIVLISGGGSALLPAPLSGISLADKQAVTRHLMRVGANIGELNTVRRALSEVKGGGLLRACRAGVLVSLIISDVSGDPLETIASGPTVDLPADPREALHVLERFRSQEDPSAPIPASISETLQRRISSGAATPAATCRAMNRIIGNNRNAVEAAAREAIARGYRVQTTAWDQAGIAAECGRELARKLCQLAESSPFGARQCVVSGGEPTVQLSRPDGPQKGGRNQELVLAAVDEWLHQAALPANAELALISGGTDGEDGPTDAAGAVADRELLETVRQQGLDSAEFLRKNNSYPFFEQVGGLIKTGPTHTNVMDLRVGLVARSLG